ncbi:unnamed protein product [Brachionus calyciflorus]|uniref:Uncharacterized protein n=1 Tax=Brachionus calyciflorus TaxID=104777 RepID=A0A814ILH7_9BILA|nr:unnamed protein product [Brachionus calyciflorus]
MSQQNEVSNDQDINLNALDLANEPKDCIDEHPINKTSSSTSICSSTKNNEYEGEINRLKDLIRQKELDHSQLEARLIEIEQHSKQEMEILNSNLNQKLEESIKKILADSQKDKNSMVMKYVEGERKCIDLNKTIQIQQSKMNDMLKEKQHLLDKIEKSKLEYEKLSRDNDAKLKDSLEKKKEIEKLREKIVINDAKESASGIKLKIEIDAHLQTKHLVEELKIKIKNLEENLNSIPQVESEKSQENNNNQENLRPISPINSESEILKKELTLLKSQIKEMFEERTVLREKVKQYEIDKNSLENSISKYKETLQAQKNLNKDMFNENLQLREHQETWTKDMEEKKEMEHKLILYKTEISELEQEMALNKNKQNELLAFTSKLTEKNTLLQSENSILSEKLDSLQTNLDKANSILVNSNEHLKSEIEKLTNDLSEIQTQNEQLKRENDEKTSQLSELSIKLSDVQDENVSLKKKHAANIKDLTRQLQVLQKKQIQSTMTTPTTSIPENSTQMSSQNSSSSIHKISRTSSINSLNLLEDDTRSIDSSFFNPPPTPNFNNEVICGGTNTIHDDVYIVDVDKQKIIDKIVKLQKTLAKRNEKIDFLQEHVNQLTNDLKKKTKIIQSFAMSGDDVSSFTSEEHDMVKRELSRKTSNLMGNDNHMTMELCLEINRKLQALLEDTLIKNLTLKESLDTLGREIANLSKENRELKMKFT